MRPRVNTRHSDEHVEPRVKLDHGTPTTRSTGHANQSRRPIPGWIYRSGFEAQRTPQPSAREVWRCLRGVEGVTELDEGCDEAVPGLQMVQIYKTGDAYAIAVAKSNPKLREVINRMLADMRKDGTHALLFQKWFQVQPPGR